MHDTKKGGNYRTEAMVASFSSDMPYAYDSIPISKLTTAPAPAA